MNLHYVGPSILHTTTKRDRRELDYSTPLVWKRSLLIMIDVQKLDVVCVSFYGREN